MENKITPDPTTREQDLLALQAACKGHILKHHPAPLDVACVVAALMEGLKK